MADGSVTRMIQALSSLQLSPEQLGEALQSPQRMMELVQLASDADPGLTEPDQSSIKQELDTVKARLEDEARLPPQKPPATRRADLERINADVAQEMSSDQFCLLRTYIGQKKSFSTTPMTQLRNGKFVYAGFVSYG